MANRLLTPKELGDSIDAVIAKLAAAKGITKEAYYALLRDEWNSMFEEDDNED